MNKVWRTHTSEYYSAVKKNEVCTHVPMWMNLEDVMLGERSRTQKGIYCVVLLTQGTWKCQVHKDNVEWWLSEVGGEGDWGSQCLIGTQFLFGNMFQR